MNHAGCYYNVTTMSAQGQYNNGIKWQREFPCNYFDLI